MRQIRPSITHLISSCQRILPLHPPEPLSRLYPPRRHTALLNSTTSSTKGNTGVEYRWIDGIEWLERYQPGGYHPILIGDVLVNRYRVVHKLGYGTYSTIWLAHDQQRAAYVAIKISTADAPPREVEILRALAMSPPDHPGRAMTPIIQDQFELLGPNGSHRCYVTSPARSSVAAAKFSCCFEIKTARVLAAQLVLAVSYTHTRGFVHGDIHLGNVLLRLPSSIDQLSTEQLYKQFGEPCTEELVRLDGKPLPPSAPSYGIVPVWLGKHANMIPPCEARLLLSDFGEAFSPSAQERLGNECHAPLPVLPPEAHFEPEKPVSFPSDIWTLACSMWPILGMQSLFDGTLATHDDIASQQVDTVGISSFPPEWWSRWEARHEYFDETGQPNEGRSVFLSLDRSFEQDIQTVRREEGMEEFGREETAALLAMLRAMLVFRPEDRATAEWVMASDWMVRWGLPEWERVRRTSGCRCDDAVHPQGVLSQVSRKILD